MPANANIRTGARGFLSAMAPVDPRIEIFQQDERNPVRQLREDALNASGAFRAAAPLPPEAGEELDAVVTEVGTQRLGVAAALIQYAERPLANWWGTTAVQYLKNSEQGRARATMYPGGRGATSQKDRTAVSTPIYAFEEDFEYHERFMAVAQGSGVQLEDESLASALININELSNDFAINGPSVNFGAISTVYGLDSAPDKNTGTLSGSNAAWDHASKTGEEILDDYQAMRDALVADKFNGPYILITEKNYQSPLEKPYSDGVTTNYGRSVGEMLLAHPELLDIVIDDQIGDDEVYLVDVNRQSCGMYVGQDPTWIPMGVRRFQHEFLALACMVAYFRNDYNSGSGVANYTV